MQEENVRKKEMPPKKRRRGWLRSDGMAGVAQYNAAVILSRNDEILPNKRQPRKMNSSKKRRRR